VGLKIATIVNDVVIFDVILLPTNLLSVMELKIHRFTALELRLRLYSLREDFELRGPLVFF